MMRGVFTIPVTPFDRSGEVDEAGLRRCVAFCLDAGAHGLVAPVNASEFTALTDDERRQVAEIVVETAGGRVPVVIGVSGATGRHASVFARHARKIRADAVIAMPPYVRKASPDEITEYFRVVAGAAELPVFIQNYQAPVGTPLSPAFMARLVAGIDGFEICERAKADETTRQIPIIFLTAQPQPSAVARAMALGAAGYLVKPFDPIKIIDQINEALTRVQAPLITK